MKVLQPHRISGEILDVIYESKQRLVIVSPYVNFNNWRQMADALINALKRGVKIDFFVRSDADNANSWEQVEQLGIVPKLVDNLHAKFYLSEQTGVISSMNLLSFSNSNSTWGEFVISLTRIVFERFIKSIYVDDPICF